MPDQAQNTGTTVRLRDLLLENKLVSQRQIDEALQLIEKRGGRLAETLVDLSYLNEDKLEKLISSRPGIASIDLSRYTVVRDLCKLIPEEIVVRHQIFPIDKMGKLLTVGMVMPIDAQAVEELKNLTGLRIKSVYCKPLHIKQAIQKYYQPNAWMQAPPSQLSKAGAVPAGQPAQQPAPPAQTESPAERSQGPSAMIRIAKLLREIDDLPALPETVERTKAALNDDDVPISSVVEIVQTDPLVSARLIKLANSAMYNIANRVDNVAAAVPLLGLKETYNIVLASAILNFAESTKAFDFRRFWEEAMFASSAIRGLSAVLKARPPSALMTAALMHDIGRFAMAHAAPEDYSRINPKLRGNALIDAEEEIFGLSHPEAAFVLAHRWDLPEEVFVPIRYHHSPKEADEMVREAGLINLAGYMAEAYADQREINKDTDLTELQPGLEAAGLTPDQLVKAYRETILTHGT